ncbi:MAG: hypothetical protein K2W92_02840 [Alphaproteobacteria bacterium]|nr:hypothetical protein [Alphaproteobacteria bacterium]
MNNELKSLNKQIRFINEIICLNELFKEPKYRHCAGEMRQKRELELIISKYRAKPLLTTSFINVIEQVRFFGEKTKEIKRIVSKDKLVSIVAIEEETGNRFPYSTNKFIEMISKISFDR